MSTSLIAFSNLYSLAGQRALNLSQSSMGKSIERLSSGLRINSSFDDPSGISVSEKMRGYIAGFKRAASNAQNGVSYLQTAEGATNEISSMLQRMRELAVESSNGVFTSNDRAELQKEMDQLKEEIDRISEATEFNTQKLLNGSTTGSWNTGNDKISAVINGNVKDGNYDIFAEMTPGSNQVQSSQILSLREGALGAEITDRGSSNVASVQDPKDLEVSAGTDYSVTVADGFTAGDTAEVAGYYKQKGSNFEAMSSTAIQSNSSGYMQIEFTEDNASAGAAGTKFRVRFISAEDGKEGDWMEFDSVTAGSLTGVYTSNGFSVSFEIPLSTSAAGTVKKGDKFLMTVSDNKGLTASDTLLISGGGTIRVGRGGEIGPRITYAGASSLTKPDNKDGAEDINNVTIYSVSLDPATGDVKKGRITLGFKENSLAPAINGRTLSGVVTLEVRGQGEAAGSSTRLSEIANFIDADGNDIFQSSQEIRIYGNSKYTTIYLEGADTMEDVVKKISAAIVKDLDMGSGNTAVDKKLVQYVPSEGGKGSAAVRGSLVVQTALTGEASQLSFIGNQKLMDALGFSETRKAENNVSKITAKNNLTGVIEGELFTSDEVAKGLIEGVDVRVDTRAGAEAYWNETTGYLEFKKSDRLENKNLNLHIVDARTTLQIGVEEGETIDISIPQLDIAALGIEKSVITSQEEAQKAIQTLDDAIAKTVSVRGTIGAKINRLESAMRNLENSRENVTTSESRIRDVDVAAETTAMASAQMMYQANMTMLAQANQLPQKALTLLMQ